MKLLKKFGFPINLELKPELQESLDTVKITVYLENEEIDMFYSRDYSNAIKHYSRGYLMALNYKIR